MPLKISARSAVEPFHAMDVLAKANALAAQGKPVLSLALGQPGAQAPLAVRQAASEAALHGRLGYTDALGRAQTRQAIADHYMVRYGIKVPASRIAVTTGSSTGFLLAFLALSEAGGRVAIASPGYPAYRNIIHSLSLETVEIWSRPQEGRVFDLESLVAQHREKPIDALLIASPANPTGTIVSEAEMREIIATCAREGIAFISDEIYHGLNYVSDDMTALSISDDVIIINSFSKYCCMTGWRIGWMVLPEALVRTVERLTQSLFICAPDLSQIAAPHAFTATAELEAVKDVYRANRTLLLDRLPKMGIEFASSPDGAFYAWCDVSAHTNDSMDFAQRMLEEIHVAAAPGSDFDPVNGPRLMRISYAGSTQTVAEALDRMDAWLNK